MHLKLKNYDKVGQILIKCAKVCLNLDTDVKKSRLDWLGSLILIKIKDKEKEGSKAVLHRITKNCEHYPW